MSYLKDTEKSSEKLSSHPFLWIDPLSPLLQQIALRLRILTLNLFPCNFLNLNQLPSSGLYIVSFLFSLYLGSFAGPSFNIVLLQLICHKFLFQFKKIVLVSSSPSMAIYKHQTAPQNFNPKIHSQIDICFSLGFACKLQT